MQAFFESESIKHKISMKKNIIIYSNSYDRHIWIPLEVKLSVFIMLVLIGRTLDLTAQPIQPQLAIEVSPAQTILSGTLHLYLVTDYGEGGQIIDQYQKTGEGEYVAFILKTDKQLDMTQYLDKEDVENLVEYSGETKQSAFMLVPTFDLAGSFSEKDFAAQFAHKPVRVTGTLFVPMAGWHYVTPVAMAFSRVEVVE